MKKSWTVFAYLVWFGFFAFEILSISLSASKLDRARQETENLSRSFVQAKSDLSAVIRQTSDQTQEMEFLNGVLNLIPQDKGTLRTQKAITDEVQSLRKQISKRLGDRIHIVVDTKTNKLFVKKGSAILWDADCSVGRGGMLYDQATGRRWEFVTPRGEFKVLSKLEHPVWTKPDWAFVESGQPVPPPEDPQRKAEGELGDYVLNLGDGYLIHGTKNEDLLGTAVSHGCVRLGKDNLDKLYHLVPLGTKVYIY